MHLLTALTKTVENLSRNNQLLVRDLNPELPEYGTKVLSIQP
jgi:hypothetical protein